MYKKRRPTIYLGDIKKAIAKIEKYTKRLSFADFQKNQLVIDAVIRNLEVIGEAAKNLPPAFRDKRSDIPWSQIIGMRNFAAHEYFALELDIIWRTIKEDIPLLKKKIR